MSERYRNRNQYGSPQKFSDMSHSIIYFIAPEPNDGLIREFWAAQSNLPASGFGGILIIDVPSPVATADDTKMLEIN